MSGSSKVLMVGLDAFEPALLERWTADGSLPTLASLMARGTYRRLSSPSEWLVGSPWPSFYTGLSPTEHGLYHYLVWDPERMENVRATADGPHLEPFWRSLGREGIRSVVVDVPLSPPPQAFAGVELNGWATHDRLQEPASHPADLLARVERRFGPPPLEDEIHRPLATERLLATRDELVEAVDRVAGVATELMETEPWDLSLVCFSSTHRGGHKLWVDPEPVSGAALGGGEPPLADALWRVYAAADAALARLMAAAGPEVEVLVFSLHGMGPNSCHTSLLPDMLGRVLSGGEGGDLDGRGRTSRLLHRLRGLVPLTVRNEVKRRLPVGLQDRLTSYWRTGGLDWESTRAFCPAADLQGYVRLNLVGREARGIVDPGEVEELHARIAEGLLTFADADTGAPVVRAVARPRDVFPPGPAEPGLPDLLVRWEPYPVAHRRAIRSPRYGTISWPTPGQPPDGRPGNHRPEGLLLAARGRLDRLGAGDGGADALPSVLDLAPTVFGLFGLAAPPAMRGSSLLPP